MFDISSVQVTNDYKPCEILHPTTDAPTGFVIRIAGADTKTFAKIKNEMQAERMKQVGAQGKGRNKLVDGMIKALSDTEALEIEMLVKATEGWSGLAIDKKEVAFTPEKAREMYTDHPWLVRQLKAFVEDLENFIRN